MHELSRVENETKCNNLRMNQRKIDTMLNTLQDSRAEWINVWMNCIW
jgi:hypothetical protein